MFSPGGSFNPFQYATNHTMIGSSFTDTANPSSLDDYSPAFLRSYDSFLDDYHFLEVDEILAQQQQQQQILESNSTTVTLPVETHEETNPPEASNQETRSNNKKKRNAVGALKQAIRQRRTGKKDRHSKIHTAQGPRDRRMRLSLQIARKFFDLQDMLGFDKASKTIDWLFTKSETAIKELIDSLPRVSKSRRSTTGGKSLSSTSESEVVSGIKQTPDTNQSKRVEEAKSNSSVSISKEKEKRRKKVHKPVFNPVDRESREKARARARERTREKKNKWSQSPQANPKDLEKIGSSSPLEYGENLASAGCQEISSPGMAVAGEEESSCQLLQQHLDSVSITDSVFGITNPSTSSSIFDFSQSVAVPSGANFEEDEYSEFPANWGMTNGRVQYRYCQLPNLKLPPGNIVQDQNPNNILLSTPYALEQNLSTMNMNMTTLNAQEESPNSVFMNLPNLDQQTTIPIRMATTTDDINGNQFSSNPFVARDYGCLY